MEKNNTNKYIAIGVVLVIIAIGAFVWIQRSGTKPVENNQVGSVQGAETGAKRFSGTVSAVDTGCFADAVCSVTIDEKKVILVQGGRGLPPDTVVGKLIGVNSVGDLESKMGAFANVYAGLTPQGDYTLYGNSDYFVEITQTSDK